MNLSIEQINSILNDLWNFYLVLFGVALSVFTLLYSFIINKRDELRNISEQVKTGNKSPILAQKETFAKIYIYRLKSVNKSVINIIVFAFILLIISWYTLRIISINYFDLKKIAMFLITASTIFIILYSILIFIKIYNHYRAETKI